MTVHDPPSKRILAKIEPRGSTAEALFLALVAELNRLHDRISELEAQR